MTPAETAVEAKRRYNRETQRAWRAANREKALATKRAWNAKNIEKRREEDRLRRADPEIAAKMAANRRKHESSAHGKAAKRARVAQYYKSHPEKLRAYNLANRKRNPGTHLACIKARKLRQKRAVPAWADMKTIRQVYADATRITVSSGKLHHVDHIIPLAGKTVCGLHVATNLRVIEASENMRKHNAFIEELVS
jgi:hypothetical protein